MDALSTVSRDAARTSARLWEAAAAALAAMPLAMAVAHRSSPLVITLATFLALAALVAEGEVHRFIADARAAAASPLGRAVFAFMLWAVLSVAWSGNRAASAQALVEFFLTTGATAGLALLLPGRVPRYALWVVAGAVALACASMLLELATGMALRRAIGVRSATYIFNRPVLTAVILTVPVLLWLEGRPKGRIAQIAVMALVVLTAATSESGAAVLAVLALAAAFGLARALPRLAGRLITLGILAALATAPVIGEIAERAIPAQVHGQLASSHTHDRVEIWRSFGAAIRGAPILGAGFGSSAKLDTGAATADVAPELHALLGVGHPHNAAIQIWAELGVIGAIIAALVLLMTLRTLSRLPPRQWAAAIAVLVGVASVSLVGHGAWQGWWAASVGAALVWFRVAARQESAP
jgi:O-antigen ligase